MRSAIGFSAATRFLEDILSQCCSSPYGRSRYDRPKQCKFPSSCHRPAAISPAAPPSIPLACPHHQKPSRIQARRVGACSRRSHRLNAAAARMSRTSSSTCAHRRDGERRRALRRSIDPSALAGFALVFPFADAHATSGQLEHGRRRRVGRRPRHRIWTPRGRLGRWSSTGS